jgi:hypothetical protein
MTETELFAQLERNVDDAVQAELASRRTPIQRGKNTVQDVAGRLGLAALRKIKNNRAYAVESDPESMRELAALVIAARGSKTSLVHALGIISQIVPGWIQDRPADDAGTLPPWPKDPHGTPIRNAWLPLAPRHPNETTPHYDHASQHVIRTLSPALARWMEESAKNGGQPSAAMCDALDAERLEAEHLRAIDYGDKQWAENKLRKELSCTITEQGQFAKNIEDPALLAFHRKEAAMKPIRCGYDNLTFRMALFQRDPAVREVHRAAGELVKSWQQEQQAKAA